jgi:hypothetical protein
MIESDTDSLSAPTESDAAGALGNEIEITPEMIKAGVSELLAADFRVDRHEDVVREILIEALKTNR